MEITPQLFEHIAHLSRLQFEPGEKEGIRRDMQQMVSFFEKLNELDVTGIPPLVFLSGTEQQLREDEPVPAPQPEQSFFTVPKVIENPGS